VRAADTHERYLFNVLDDRVVFSLGVDFHLGFCHFGDFAHKVELSTFFGLEGNVVPWGHLFVVTGEELDGKPFGVCCARRLGYDGGGSADSSPSKGCLAAAEESTRDCVHGHVRLMTE
jgi:hypothetical protein